jgi:dienelactone hydrolase
LSLSPALGDNIRAHSDLEERIMKNAVALFTACVLLSAASAARATISSVLGGAASCTVQGDGQRHCAGIFTSFDGAPIDVNVGFPAVPASGPDGHFPIVGIFHGWGGSKIDLTSGSAQEWLDEGYAVFSMSDRGWGNSCGGSDPKRLMPGVCDNGYNHLMDTRYEVRDAQEVFAALADQAADGAANGEGLVDPVKIASMGGSYGGGMSMALGALKNRTMLPDGSLVPWTSGGGKALSIAAAQPDIPWTDLAYSLTPNGHTLDYVVDAPYLARGRVGVMKQSFVAGLFATGLATSNYAPAGADPDADLITWFAAINAGEPYDGNPLSADIVDETTTHHSSYYIDDATPPAPLLISNGWTDDLFPPDEAIRFYNRTRNHHPGTPIALIFSDHGHQRGQNKGPDAAFRGKQRHAWFDFYVKGVGAQPLLGVQTLTTTCGGASGGASGDFDDADLDVPFSASSWAALAPGEITIPSAAAQTVTPSVATDGPVGQAFDPISGDGACATASGTDQTGAATYRGDPAPASGFTLMGSPTVVADIASAGPTSQLAARLLDVDPVSGMETLVARGLYRPEIGAGATRQVFQLHPNGWKFAEGHVAKLELLPADQPYGRSSNGQTTITVANLELRLPVLEQPGCGLVKDPAPKVVPAGYTLADDFVDDGSGCASCPREDCRLPATPGKGLLAIKDKPGSTSDRLQWSWANGAATSKADFGNPLVTTGYRLCIYDGGTNVVHGARAPGGGLCDGKPCWRETAHGFKYRKRDAAGSMLQIAVKDGVAGKAKIGVVEKATAVPTLPLAEPARVQLVNDAGICWEARYAAPASRNDAGQFKDKAD